MSEPTRKMDEEIRERLAKLTSAAERCRAAGWTDERLQVLEAKREELNWVLGE